MIFNVKVQYDAFVVEADCVSCKAFVMLTFEAKL